MSHRESSLSDLVENILSEAEYEWHVNLEPFDNVETALKCPVTEVAMFYFPGELPAEYMKIFHKFRAAAEDEENCGLLASAGGSAHQEVDLDGSKGKVVMFVAGWRSVDAHKDFENTNTYREHMPRLIQGISRVDAHHVSFQHVA